MDLDIIASVQENIIGHCLCVLGDSMAMPVGAWCSKFRDEFEAAIDRPARASDDREPSSAARPSGTGRGRLADAAAAAREDEHAPATDHPRRRRPRGRRRARARCWSTPPSSGDVEIPVFCYEPKLGEPVGACRMCLVEIEGMPKLQTACSTPVRDGMVVYTRTDQVKGAQNAVVEFLLVNHPLDCPVCDKGGECPLQDIAMGWGPGAAASPTPSATSRSRSRSRR